MQPPRDTPDRQRTACLALYLQEDKDTNDEQRKQNPAVSRLFLNLTELNDDNKKFIKNLICNYPNNKIFKECFGKYGTEDHFSEQ